MDNNPISEAFKVHDKYQIEMKYTYPLDPARRENEYHVDTYFFLPKNLFINRATYQRNDFYSDMQRYIRLKTPAYLLRIIIDGDNCPLKKLARAMERLATQGGENHRKSYHERLKMFCSIMKSALRDEEQFLENSATATNLATLIHNFLDCTNHILSQFRDLEIILQTPSVSGDNRELFALVDEFLSITANKYRCRLWAFINTLPAQDWTEETQQSIIAAIRRELDHRRERGYPSLPSAQTDNEEMIYREGVLKKIMASILFLHTATRRDGVIRENILFMVAAGVAMLFATGIAFGYKLIFLTDFTLSFFLIWVFTYMWKDRIKEWLRGYFQKKLKTVIYDYCTTVTSELGRKVGICKESFSFINESDLNPTIAKIRNKSFMSVIENGELGEDIILARKLVRVNSAGCANIFADFNVNGIVDIMRFNVRKFLEKMDNPVKEVLLPDEEGRITKSKAKRVYHVNVIIHYQMGGQADSYRRFRLILSRNGIKRLEVL